MRRLRAEGIPIAVPTRVLKVTSQLSQQQQASAQQSTAHQAQQEESS